ncbi:Helix-turn-helix domain-containing protein [Lentzea fradiae]|uniref:Helix-turn-helix domain-containing protein n=1 Tax=Lentzea fradiae TaxID=200378 RepID=A0A1G7M656_9PSEU|nr:helix-turn-helix transcriptional regulator [Lentzea fradiae]SDF57191.1 Helix-turn-helix domain-containing protein [Lentzea fradiae]
MTDEPSANDIGRRLRQIRHARGKSLAVVAGLAGISTSYLSRLESGARALDRRSLIVNLANALEVAPSEISGAGLVSPGRLAEDRSLNEVRLALAAAGMHDPRGEIVPVEMLSSRATALLDAQRDCRLELVGAELPLLIRDLHATLEAGHDVSRLLALVHVQGTQAWLTDIGANPDLAWQAVTLAQQAAARADDPFSHAVSAFGTAFGLMAVGAFDLASQALSAPAVGTKTKEAAEVTGMLALTSSLTAAASGNRAEQQAALDHAADLARHTGEGNTLWFGFGPGNVGVWRMSVALEAGDHATAARIATTVTPETLPSATRRATYWREYGRALAHLPRRFEEAVAALRRAEQISPAHVQRHPFMRSVLAELLTKAKRDSAGRELRGMAHRAGLVV